MQEISIPAHKGTLLPGCPPATSADRGFVNPVLAQIAASLEAGRSKADSRAKNVLEDATRILGSFTARKWGRHAQVWVAFDLLREEIERLNGITLSSCAAKAAAESLGIAFWESCPFTRVGKYKEAQPAKQELLLPKTWRTILKRAAESAHDPMSELDQPKNDNSQHAQHDLTQHI